MSLPVLDLPSDPRERGEAHGEALGAEARALYEAHLAQLIAQPAIQARGVTDDASYQAYGARHQAHVEAFAPDLWTEMEGIAAGAGMTPHQILALNLYLESYDLPHPNAPAGSRKSDTICPSQLCQAPVIKPTKSPTFSEDSSFECGTVFADMVAATIVLIS